MDLKIGGWSFFTTCDIADNNLFGPFKPFVVDLFCKYYFVSYLFYGYLADVSVSKILNRNKIYNNPISDTNILINT